MTKTMRKSVEEILLSVMNDYTGNSESNLPDATNNMMNLFNSQLQSVFEKIEVEIEMLRGREDNQINYYPLYKAMQRLEKEYLPVKDKK